ncbi:GL21362 [Drosophila persimilis]|uniref:GL21362 n=1 Tax=Drosophila persimilis TaxID=7234 RepID=B4HBA2_DROPE|nr:vanin-like protein 3 [Drosophila persimilis]EDW37914.1 GL21362 [Drosophila persimilis]
MCLKRWLVVCVAVVHLAGRPVRGDGDFYTAGVAEFRPAVLGGSSEQLLEENLSAYLELIAAANGTSDILVFPEATLNSVLKLTAVPEQTENSLCEKHDGDDPQVAEFLRRLACAARSARTYLVVNVKERSEEDPIPSRGYNIYNTNVVFDRNGAVVSRYRKWNLYLEPLTNRTKSAELAIFRTDFGVTFGHFICFDMLFYSPAQELVERLGVRHLIVTKMFNSELPFLTATQLQQGWAWANNVTLLAAGASMPLAGISGSGIYAGHQGALTRIMVSNQTEGRRQLLLAQVSAGGSPWMPTKATIRNEGDGAAVLLKLLQQPDIGNFSTWALPLVNGSSASKRLCQADLCCDFRLSWNLLGAQSEYHYRLGVSVAERRYEEEQYSSIRVCGLFACRDGSPESCGLLSNQTVGGGKGVEFTSLWISGEFVKRQRRLLMPSTLASSLYALQPSEVAWTLQEVPGNDTHTHTELELRQPHRHLLTFALYGNYFDEFASNGGARTEAAVWRGILMMWLLTMVIHTLWK